MTLAVMTEPAAAETLRSAARISAKQNSRDRHLGHLEGDETLQDLDHKLDTMPSAKLDPAGR